jgi:hypothetical protein
MAHCWQASEGFPPEISRVLSQRPEFANIEPLFIVPERQVALDNHRAPSQNDVWVLAKATSGLVSIAVEGKVDEPFDVTLGEWRAVKSKGRASRLEFLTKTLALTDPLPSSLRYQLLHRAASAVIEAQRFGAAHAVMLVHSFSRDRLWFDDFAAFCSLFGLSPRVGQLVSASASGNIPLHLGWVPGDERFLAQCSCCPDDSAET